MAEAVQVSRRLRRLIAACDGTWNSTDRQTHTTKVVRLARSIRSCTSDGISQIVYYHPGVGTGNVLDHWVGGGVGVGLSQIVRSVYAWFVDNYQDGDEIFLFGFSRGLHRAKRRARDGPCRAPAETRHGEFQRGLGVLSATHGDSGQRGTIVSGQFPRPYPSRPAEDQVHRRLGYGWVTGHSR